MVVYRNDIKKLKNGIIVLTDVCGGCDLIACATCDESYEYYIT